MMAMIGIDRNVGSALIFASGRVAVHDRQLDSHQDKVRPPFGDRRRRLLAVLSLGDFVVGASEHVADNLTVIRLTLQHQNMLAHATLTCRSTMTGSVKANVEP
jgi:hypothetical protein